MSNRFTIGGSNAAIIDFLKSSIETSDEVIAHYDFVVKDISSTISDPLLEATKGPTVEFLKKMKEQWENFRDDQKRTLEDLEAQEAVQKREVDK